MSEAPTGTVTLVFTDIEGSTDLWEAIPEAMEEALATHNQTLRDLGATHQAFEVKTEGDAFFMAFGDPNRALKWCLEAQVRLNSLKWNPAILKHPIAQPDESGSFRGLRVRMGIHTCAPQCTPDPVTGRMDYFGAGVNRAARIGAAAHGGQVIVSEAAWQIVRSNLGDAISSDLGVHAMKGLDEREHLYQILPRELGARRFPRLRTLNVKSSNLPPLAGETIGRDQDLAELADTFDSGARLVTLFGPGGIGKTRLSLTFGHQQRDEYPGGVWFCDLTQAEGIDVICDAVAVAMDVSLAREDPVARLAESIAARGDLLMILDNFEQVSSHAQESVGRWMREAPQSRWLVSSREALHLSGERLLELEPLGTGLADGVAELAPAVQLFVERASEVKRGFELNDDNREAIHKIVADLDGLPLAIELAAARVRSLTPQKLLERLEKRFDLLKSSRRDLTKRQSTLRGAIEWSWNLLEDWERAALAQLSVFRGGFFLEAAEDVLDLAAHDDAPLEMDAVEALRDKSLVRAYELPDLPGEQRYGFYESIRAFAAERLSEMGELARATHHRHAEYYANLGKVDELNAMYSEASGVRFKSLGADLSNVHSAIEYGLENNESSIAILTLRAVSQIASVRGPTAIWLDTAKRVSAMPGLDSGQKAAAGMIVGWANASAGNIKASVDAFRDSLEHARDAEYTWAEAMILCGTANGASKLGELDRARDEFQQALDIAETIDDLRNQGNALMGLGSLALRSGEQDGARDYFSRALTIYRKMGDRRGEPNPIMQLARMDMLAGDNEAALKGFQRALNIARELGNSRAEGQCLAALGDLHASREELESARECYEEALAIQRAIGNRPLMEEAQGKLDALA